MLDPLSSWALWVLITTPLGGFNCLDYLSVHIQIVATGWGIMYVLITMRLTTTALQGINSIKVLVCVCVCVCVKHVDDMQTQQGIC